MNLGKAVRSGFAHYVDFRGRASRSEFWFWVLFATMCSFMALFVDIAITGIPKTGPIGVVVMLILFLPWLSMAIRRLHDLDYRGWSVLISFIPALGLAMIIPYCMKGTDGPNRYGADPLGGLGPRGGDDWSDADKQAFRQMTGKQF